MTKIYELCFLTEDNEWHNLLYKNEKDAYLDKTEIYCKGRKHYGMKILCSFVADRIVF